MSEVTVSADDVRLVTAALGGLSAAVSIAVLVPGFPEALEAAQRLAIAAGQAGMPPDPVSGPEQMAIAHHQVLEAYIGQGFERDEAFAMLQMIVAAGLGCCHG